MRPGDLEIRWTYVVFGVLLGIDLLIAGRIMNRMVLHHEPIPRDAPLFFLLVMALQVLLGWLYFRLRHVLRYYRLLKESYEQELDFARQVMDSSGQGMLVVDDRYRITYANKAMAALLERSVEDLLRTDTSQLVTEDDQSVVMAERQKRWQGQVGDFVLHLKLQGGRTLPVTVHSNPRWHHGRIVGAFISMAPVSETSANPLNANSLVSS